MVSQGRRFRMWGLVGWLALAAGGGACSQPNSLVQLDVDTSALAPDTSDATMHINIEQDHYVIKTVQESLNKLVPVIPETKKFQIGVYLPAHVSGEVTVVVVIIDSKGCSVGSGNTVTVKVTAGAAANTATRARSGTPT